MTALEGSRVLVTGAASGLGRRLALGIARRKGTLVLWDLNREGLEKVAEEARGAELSIVDVSDREKLYEAARRIEGPVDVVINNAGVVSGKSLLDLPDESIEKSFAVNTTLDITLRLLRHIRKRTE